MNILRQKNIFVSASTVTKKKFDIASLPRDKDLFFRQVLEIFIPKDTSLHAKDTFLIFKLNKITLHVRFT